MDFNTTVLAKGTPLYRGTASRSQSITRQMWFAHTPSEAQIYGYVTEYETTRPIVVLRMDDPDNILKLSQLAAEKNRRSVVEAIDDSFRVVGRQIIRNSESAQDRAILNFICEIGLAGFSSQPIRKSLEGESFFHSETGLCDARDQVRQLGLVDLDYTQRGAEREAFKLKQAREKARRARRPQYDDDDEDYAPVGKQLFFG